MPRDPQERLTGEGVQQERPFEVAPEEMTEPDKKRNTVDPDWLSMATADPAHSLKDSTPE